MWARWIFSTETSVVLLSRKLSHCRKMNNQESSSNIQDAASGAHVVHTIRSIITKTKLDSKTVGFVDSENYMLRGISPGPESRTRSSSLTGNNASKSPQADVDLDMLCLSETMKCLTTTETEAGISPDVSTTTCARVMSLHTLFCTCNISCCCMCGSLCSPDCHACYHKLCARITTTACHKNGEPLPKFAVDNDKVSTYNTTIYCYIFKHSITW